MIKYLLDFFSRAENAKGLSVVGYADNRKPLALFLTKRTECGKMAIDEFSTTQAPTYWLFADMLYADKENVFEFVKAEKLNTKTSRQIPGIILLGQAKGKEDVELIGEFQCSVWNLTPTDAFKEKYPKWTDVKPATQLKFTASKGGRMIVEEAVLTEKVK